MCFELLAYALFGVRPIAPFFGCALCKTGFLGLLHQSGLVLPNPRRRGAHQQEDQNGDCDPIRKKHGTVPRRRPCKSYLLQIAALFPADWALLRAERCQRTRRPQIMTKQSRTRSRVQQQQYWKNHLISWRSPQPGTGSEMTVTKLLIDGGGIVI